MPTPAKAFTTTPDPTAGNPIDVVTLDAGAGTVDRQVVTVADATTPTQYAAISATGAVKVDGSAVTQPVSGTFFPATQPVSATALPLPAGAATLAGQTQPGVDIGDVTINNAAAGAAVNIQDGGNSITVDGTVTTTPPANASTNVAQLAGTAPSVNSGTKDAGTLRVVLATDQPALTNKLLVTPDSVALPANQSVNVNQVGGTNIVTSVAGAPAMGGDTANAATDAGNPVKTGGKALTNYSIPATVTTGQRVNAWYDLTGAQVVKLKTTISYSAPYRLIDSTAGQLSLTFTFVANTNKQLATIYHANTATKTVRIRKIVLVIANVAATVGVLNFEIRALSAATAPATGNPAITPRMHDPIDGAAEATCLALPTTAGSLVGADTGTVGLPFEFNAGATTAPTNALGLDGQALVLFEANENRGIKPLTMRAATAEGFAINGRSTAATVFRFLALIEFTEE